MLIGKNLVNLSSEENKDRVKAYLKELKIDRKSNGIYNAQHKNGSTRLIYFRTIVITTASGREYVMGNGIDITDRVEIEHKLKKAIEKAEKNAKAKDEFLANMSHEIRTPMNAVMGFTDLLKDSTLTNQQHDFVNAISTAGHHLLVIINDILDSSKIESGQLQLEYISFNLPAAILDAKRLMKDNAADKNLKFNFFVESEIPQFIMGDPVRFNQILINLIGNALKFTAKGKVEVFCSLLDLTEEGCKIEIRIKDTGIGIPKEKQPLIFSRFQQADDSTNRKFGGTGLGLSISKQLLEMQGGTLRFLSEEHVGTEFIATISFDLDKMPAESLSSIPETKDFTGVNILLVEDNELNQVLALQHLGKVNAVVELAENGEIAIQKLKLKDYDLILMDLQMPIMDGYVATQIIREGMHIDTPIIAMTAHSLVGESDKCLSLGMNDYLSKPYKKEDLLKKMRLALDNITTKNLQKEAIDKKPIGFNFATFLDYTGDNHEFGIKLALTYLRTIPSKIEELSSGLNAQDKNKVKQAAHYLKPSLEMFNAMVAVEYCQKMEKEPLDDYNKVLVEKIKDLDKEITTILREYYNV